MNKSRVQFLRSKVDEPTANLMEKTAGHTAGLHCCGPSQMSLDYFMPRKREKSFQVHC